MNDQDQTEVSFRAEEGGGATASVLHFQRDVSAGSFREARRALLSGSRTTEAPVGLTYPRRRARLALLQTSPPFRLFSGSSLPSGLPGAFRQEQRP